MAALTLTVARVLTIYRYERETGRFFWRANSGSRGVAGAEAGMSGPKGKKIITVDGKRYSAEKIVWLLEHGEIPTFRLGYADGSPGNVSISNLVPLRRPRFTKEDISREDLVDLVDYNPESGKFTWKHRPLEAFASARAWAIWKSRYVGVEAGHVDRSGYIDIRIRNKLYPAHRLAWLYAHGRWPDNVIDHINGDPSDNRICNLRDFTIAVNLQNMRKPNANNKTGILGVSFDKEMGKYAACIKVNSKSMHLGYFDAAECAGQAYLVAKRKHHEGCTI